MKKKQIASVVVLLVIVLGIVVFLVQTRKVSNYVTIEDVDQINVVNGSSGTVTEIKDSSKLDIMKEFLMEQRLKRKVNYYNLGGSGGYSYYMDLYKNGAKLLRITMVDDSTLLLGNRRFSIEGNNTSMEKVLDTIK